MKDRQSIQTQQLETQETDKAPWQKASGKGLQANYSSPKQYTLVTTNGFTPLRVDPQVEHSSWADKVEGQGSMKENTEKVPHQSISV